MADRALFIGVGGSGGATLHFLYNDLETRLRELGWTEGVPSAWQFLHVDATSNPDEGDRFVPPELRDSRHYLPLTAKETKFEDYTRRLIYNAEVAGGWLPGPTSAPQRLNTGAGQRRAIGRVLALESMDVIHGRVQDLINETQRPESKTELAMLGKGYLLEDVNVDGDLAVFVIASLGGGSGSGMHQDISLMLRAAFKEADRHVSVLYPADVFDSIDAGFRTGVVPNSLAGMAEILSAHFAEGNLTAAEVGALRGVPVANFTEGSRAPHLVFFQGRSNGEISLDTPGDVYRSTARALSAMLLNKENREQLKSYVQTNLSPVPSRREFLGDPSLSSGAPDWQLGMAFGYANISLGTTAFKEYGAQRLAKLVIDRVLDESSNAVRDRIEQNAQFVNRAREFAVGAGLDEASSGPDAPRGGLTGAWLEPESLMNTLKAKLDQVKDEVSRLKRSAESAGRNEVASKKSEFIQGLELRLERAQERLVLQTLASIATYGADATVQYLVQLEADLSAAAIRWSSGEGARSAQPVMRKIQPKQSTQKDGLLTRLADGIRGTNASPSDAVASGAQNLMNVIAPLRDDFVTYQTEAMAYVLQGTVVNVVKPIREALEGGRRELADRRAVDIGIRNLIGQWPGDTGESPIRAVENEVFLMEDSEFKEEFDNLLSKNLSPLSIAPLIQALDPTVATPPPRPSGSPREYEAVRSQAIFEVLGGAGERAGEKISFWPSTVTGDKVLKSNVRLAIRQPWDSGLSPDVPPLTQVVAETDELHCLKISFAVDPFELLNDARTWMETRRGIVELTKMSLGDYLSADGPEGLRRRNGFMAKFATAISMARPMTEIDDGALRAYHGFSGDIDFSTAVSVIPLSPGTSEAEGIVSLLAKEKMKEGNIHFVADSPTQEIHITRYLSRQVHPIDMANVMAPIVREWSAQCALEVNDSLFWSCRRAHRVPAFVPLPPSVTMRLAKGWILARSTQLITDEAIAAYLDGRSPLVLTANGVRHQFPDRLLTTCDPERQSDLFPALLESFVVALIDVSAGRPETLEAYAALSEIGRMSRPLIADYLQTGNLCGVSLTHAEESMEDRLRRLHDEVQDRRNGQEAQKPDEGARADDRMQFGLTWELRDLFIAALDSLLGEITAPAAKSTLKA